LLDPARAALAHGDGATAMERLGLHEQRFPNGALSQEREAMAIKALVLTGDRDRARARAASFCARYPGSLLWPMIGATLDAKHDTTSGSSF
jgi:outer membrane protein assembly factor BamD (BamD/ComL family)